MPGPLQLDHFLCFTVYSTEHAFTQFYRPLFDEIGLTYPQYLAMVEPLVTRRSDHQGDR